MKRVHGWMAVGLGVAGVAALLLSQTVFGQLQGQTSPRTTTGTMQADVPIPIAPPPAPVPGGPAANPSVPARVGVATPDGTLPPPMPPSVPPHIKPEAELTRPTPASPVGSPATNRQQSAVSVEWVGPAITRLNQATPCQIVVTNHSKVTASNVVVRHRLGKGVVLKTCAPEAANSGGELTWNLGTLTPEQSTRIELTLIARERGALHCQAHVTYTTAADHQIQVREPQLAVKLQSSPTAVEGEAVTLSVVVSNPGDGIADAVKVKTTLPDGLEHSQGKVIEVEIGNLNPKDARTIELICKAKRAGVQEYRVAATADGNLSSQDTSRLEIMLPKLDVTVTGPKMRYLDRRAVYVVKVANPGRNSAEGIQVQEQIPPGLKFNQASHGGQFNDTTRLVTWTVNEIPAGQCKELTVDVIPIELGEHRIVANAKGTRTLKSESDVRTMVEGLAALSIDVGHIDDPIEVGAETEYQIRVQNTGTKTETNVEVVCVLPTQLEFRGAKCSTTLRYRVEGAELIFDPLPKLAKNADVIYRIQVKGVAPGDIRFRTRIKSDGLREPMIREECTRVYSDEVPARSTVGTPNVPAPSVPASAPSNSSPRSPPVGAPPPIVPPVSIPAPPPTAPGAVPIPLPPPVQTGNR